MGMTRARRSLSGEDWPHVVVLDPFNAGLAVARVMVRLGARVTMLVDPDDLFVDRTRGVRSIVDAFDPDGASWISTLREIATSAEQVVALPATDRSCELLLGAAETLPANVHAFEQATSVHMALMDKQRADEIARRAGVAVPWTMRVNNREELARTASEAPWPCVVKPILSHEWRSLYGGVRAFLVADAEEAEQQLTRPLRDGVGMLLSQYIPGGDEDVEEAIVVRLADGSYPVQFGCHKLRQHPPGFGVTAVGEASELTETMTLAKRVLDEAGFVGVAGVEAKRHSETGERWFLEVNVRIPGQWGLGDSCGVQATPRLVRVLQGHQVSPQPPLREGVRIVFPDIDAHVIRPTLLAAPLLSRPAIAWRMMRAYSGARNFGLLDLRDPGPTIAWASLLARRRITRLKGVTRR
jgi:D-aspartate ligase